MGAILERFERDLAAWRERFAGRPEAELTHLLLLALEREELVAVAYRESLVVRRLAAMPVSSEARELIRQAMVWVWQDEQMHAVYLRGAILRLGRPLLSTRARLREWVGAVGGWASSQRQHVLWREAPVARALAAAIYGAGWLGGALPVEIRRHLRYRPFREFCELNVELELTAHRVYERMLVLGRGPLALPPELLQDLERVREDEERHRQIFALLADALDDRDALAGGGVEPLADRIAAVGDFFLPRGRRRERRNVDNPVGTGGDVVVVERGGDEARQALLEALDRAGLADTLARRAAELGRPLAELRVAIKPVFMMGYSRRDPSPIVDPALVRELGRRLAELGCRRITVVESTAVYERFFDNRTVGNLARYFGYDSPDYEIVDLAEEQEPHRFPRGLSQYSAGRSWRDADFRISFGKLRSHPIERALLTLGNLGGMGPDWPDHLFSDRLATYPTVIVMLLDEFPVHFALLDAFANAPDGPLGVMGSRRPRHPGRIYAARDAFALDLVAMRHLGSRDPRESTIVRLAGYWFGDPSDHVRVVGCDRPIEGWRGPCHNDLTALFGLASGFVYGSCSGRGALFVPQMDESAFPPRGRVGPGLHLGRRLIQTAFGLRLP